MIHSSCVWLLEKIICCHLWQRLSQLSCGSRNFYYFFVIYFYSKEFLSLSQKLDNHTTNSSKVHRVTLMVESSLGSPNVPKVMKEKRKGKKNTQNKSKTHDDFGERHYRTVSVFSHCQLQMYFSRIKHNLTWVNPSYQLQHLIRGKTRKKGSVWYNHSEIWKV